MAEKKTTEDKSNDNLKQPVDNTISKQKKEVTAKAGKRSAKSLKEAEVKQAKEERKQTKSKEAKAEKQTVNPTRSLLERRSKTYKEKQSLIDTSKRYSLEEASKIIPKTNPVKFDATVELHIRLNVDPRQAEQNIRDSVLLPSGSGKNVRVAAFVDGEDLELAKKANADLVGEELVIKELDAGSFSFDVLISTPSQMPKLGKYARILGPRGLMPNPKSGTVTTDVTKAINEAKAGKVEYRVDSGGNIHVPVGKVSFKPEDLLQNINAILSSVQSNKPSTIKGIYVLSAHLSTSMGPSLKLAL